MARDRAIGRDNALPWRLPEDLRRFKGLTLGHAVIMGRRTWESIGRPLPDRVSIVVTRDPLWQAAGARAAPDLDAALVLARAERPGRAAMIIGGAQIYALALPRATRLHLTEIDVAVPGADAHFPPLPAGAWRESAREAGISASGLRYAFVDYLRAA
ncbi:MAG: dihydrofolate reductase [Alphaproteobacteria bacterium]|nr:dihydrofolate reductase [Alphaproteobacteria bacterium]